MDDNVNPASLGEINPQIAAVNLSQRLAAMCCALLATREYNGPKRKDLIPDAFGLINAVDQASMEIVRRTLLQQAQQRDEGPKIITPGGGDA